MKRRRAVFLMCCFISALSSGCRQATPREPASLYLPWTEGDKLLTRISFDVAWEAAVRRGFVRGEKKPRVVFFDETPKNNCGGFAAITRSDTLTFCSSYLWKEGAPRRESQKTFMLYHEIGHVVLGHSWQRVVNSQSSEDRLAYRIRCECEANVFAGEVGGRDFTLSVIKGWHIDKKSPVYGIYARADAMAIEVLESRRKDCSN